MCSKCGTRADMIARHEKDQATLAALREVDSLVNAVRVGINNVGVLLGRGTTQVPTGGREGVVMKALYEAARDLDMASDQIILIGYDYEEIDWKKPEKQS